MPGVAQICIILKDLIMLWCPFGVGHLMKVVFLALFFCRLSDSIYSSHPNIAIVLLFVQVGTFIKDILWDRHFVTIGGLFLVWSVGD